MVETGNIVLIREVSALLHRELQHKYSGGGRKYNMHETHGHMDGCLGESSCIQLGVSVFESLYRADPYTSDHIVGQA